MATPTEVLQLDPGQPADVVARMAEMAALGDGWVNFRPDVRGGDETLPADGLFGFLSARGPDVPLCTWVPARRRRRPGRQSLGIQHATGTRAAARLASLGVPVPDGWSVTQDHPRRGLVVEVDAGETPDRLLGWLLRAGAALCLQPLRGDWVAAVYRGRKA